jgi:hypothetical protein
MSFRLNWLHSNIYHTYCICCCNLYLESFELPNALSIKALFHILLYSSFKKWNRVWSISSTPCLNCYINNLLSTDLAGDVNVHWSLVEGWRQFLLTSYRLICTAVIIASLHSATENLIATLCVGAKILIAGIPGTWAGLSFLYYFPFQTLLWSLT